MLIDREYSEKKKLIEMKPFFDHASREPREKTKSWEKKATRRNPDRSKGEPGSRTEIVPARKEDGSRAGGPENDQLVKKLKPSDSTIHNVEYKIEFALRKKIQSGTQPRIVVWKVFRERNL